MSDFINTNFTVTFDHGSLSAAKADDQESQRLVRAVQYLNRTEFSTQGQSSGSFLKFLYDPSTRKPVVEVVDHASGEVLYQMPPEQALKLATDARRRAAQAQAAPYQDDDGGDCTA